VRDAAAGTNSRVAAGSRAVGDAQAWGRWRWRRLRRRPPGPPNSTRNIHD